MQVKLVLRENRFFVETTYRDIAGILKSDKVIQQACIKTKVSPCHDENELNIACFGAPYGLPETKQDVRKTQEDVSDDGDFLFSTEIDPVQAMP